MISHLKIGNSYKNFQSLLRTMMVKNSKMLTSLLVSAGMIITSLACGGIAYGAEAPAGDENFNYNGYSATQLKKISECISGVIHAAECPSYESSSKDYYTETGGIVNHDNMPTGVISTKSGWMQWADAAMKANSYDGVYGTLRIAPGGGATGSTSSPTDVRFRLIGINQDNRADGTGKAGLTFQAIGHYNIRNRMNTGSSNSVSNSSGGWRDTLLRKNLNDESTGDIWNAIQSTDFKNNITPVLKTTNNNANDYDGKGNSDNTSNASSTTVDKLYILSPSEMGMPIIKYYSIIYGSYGIDQSDANVHYYDVYSSYKNTIKSENDGNDQSGWYPTGWYSLHSYLYAGNAYQWWMLPAGNRTDHIDDGSNSEQQAYHNTDSYSYCALLTNSNPSTNKKCISDSYWLRSTSSIYFAIYNSHYNGHLVDNSANFTSGVVVSFSF